VDEAHPRTLFTRAGRDPPAPGRGPRLVGLRRYQRIAVWNSSIRACTAGLRGCCSPALAVAGAALAVLDRRYTPAVSWGA